MTNKNAITATVEYAGELRTRALHVQSGASVVTDAPVDNHGKGEAFSPTDLVASALSSCMMTIVGIKAGEMDIDVSGMSAEVTKVMSANPRRIAEIIVQMNMPAAINEKSRIVLEATARACPVAKSLHPETKQTLVFTYI